MSESTHVAFDTKLCAANPEAAADRIAELENALAAAGGLDRTRVILLEDYRSRLSSADKMIATLKQGYDRIFDKACELERRLGEETSPASPWLGPFKDAGGALNSVRESVADMIGADKLAWPFHGNAPLAIVAVIQQYRNALAFYANPEIYKPHPHGPAFDRRDLSFKAKSALEPMEPYDPTTQPYDEPVPTA